jgi:hypothetical protein
MLPLAAMDAAGDNICVGKSCYSASSVVKSGLDWRALISSNELQQGDPFCPMRLRGCPWRSCAPLRRRGGRGTASGPCAQTWRHFTPVACRDRRVRPSPCYMLESDPPSPLEAARAAQCSGSLGEEQFVLHYFSRQLAANRTGTFIELGAFDGWMESNSLHLEQCQGWRGLLIDGQPAHLGYMRSNRPRAVSRFTHAAAIHGAPRATRPPLPSAHPFSASLRCHLMRTSPRRRAAAARSSASASPSVKSMGVSTIRANAPPLRASCR